MICPNCKRETQPGFFCHACDAYMADPLVGSNAGIASRLGAQILDWIAGWAIFFLVSLLSIASFAVGSAGGRKDLAAEGFGAFVGTFFFAVLGYTVFALWFLAQGKTPGKWCMGIRVVDKSDGSNPGLGRMLVREIIGKMASGFFLGLGFFWAIWDRESQCWHDKIAGTLVVRQVPAIATVRSATTAGTGTVGVAMLSPTLNTVPVPNAPSGVSNLVGDTRSPQALFCADCGASVLSGGRFCERCGAPLT